MLLAAAGVGRAPPTVARLGFWSAVAAATFAAVYVVAQVGEWADLLVPFLALQIYYPPLIWPASLWAIIVPGAALSLAALFGREAWFGAANGATDD